MKSELEVDDELIAKYLSGDASPEEAMAVVDWLQWPANKIQFEQLERTWNATAKQVKPTFSSAKAWARMENPSIFVEQKQTIARSWWTSKTFGIAASLFFVAATAALIVLNFWGEKNSVVSTHHEIVSVTLSDSSKITVFRFSSLEYAQHFDAKTREVAFAKGEAFFRVARDKQKPFVIHTPTANIKVVGTEFNVKVDKDQTEVAVKEGKVLVYSSSDSVFLTAGSNAIFSSEAKAKIAINHPDNNVWSYATRRLVFKDTPIETVIGDLQRVYPCTISIANKEIGNCKLTATFENDSVDKIINLIAETLSLGVKKNGDVFVLAGEGCP